MADEEDYAHAGNQVPPAFDPLDGTVEIPHPKRFVFIMPGGNDESLASRIEECTLMTIAHPRHGATQMIFSHPSGALFEVQEHSRKFGQTWLIGDMVEPRSPLYVVTPMDPAFVAIYALRGCVAGTVDPNSSSPSAPRGFLDAYTLLGKCRYLSILPPVAQRTIIAAFASLADAVDADGAAVPASEVRRRVADPSFATIGTLFFRLNDDKCADWLGRKYSLLLEGMRASAEERAAAAAALAGASAPVTSSPVEAEVGDVPPAPTDDGPADVAVFSSPTRVVSTVTGAPAVLPPSPTDLSLGLPAHLLQEKAAQLLAEYLDRANKPLMLRATKGAVDLTAIRAEALNIRRTNNTAAAASRMAMGAEAIGVDDIGGEPADKKKRAELKSASVKKLEKAGAPKGTPTLFSMFAKKAAAAPSAASPAK